MLVGGYFVFLLGLMVFALRYSKTTTTISTTTQLKQHGETKQPKLGWLLYEQQQKRGLNLTTIIILKL